MMSRYRDRIASSMRGVISPRLTGRRRRARPIAEMLEPRLLLTDFFVTNRFSTGAGSLRQAILDANADPSQPHLISVAEGLHIYLFQDLPEITGEVEIEGDPDGTTLSALAGVRGFQIALGAEVVISNFELTAFEAPAQNPGGAVYNEGDLVLTNVTLTDNTAEGGGAIYNSHGYLGLVDCTFSNNIAVARGGAILTDGGELVIYTTTFADNSAEFGGAIATLNFDSDIYFEVGQITGNSATIGGGLRTFGSVSLGGVTVADNSATDGTGGGIYHEGTAAIYNSSFWGNHSTLAGSAIHTDDLTIEITTVDGNTSDSDEAAVKVTQPSSMEAVTVTRNAGQGLSGPFYLTSSIVAENRSSSGVANDLDFNELLDDSVNWIGERDGDPLLGPLTLGTFTEARLPLPGSPVIDAGDNALNNMLSDQNANLRVVDGDLDTVATIDLGAVEFAPKAAIRGQFFSDLDSSTHKNGEEPALNGWTVQLYDLNQLLTDDYFVGEQVTRDIDWNRDGVIDPLTEAGSYLFDDLDPGLYLVELVMQEGWTRTTFLNAHEILDTELIADANLGAHQRLQQVFGTYDEIEVAVPHTGPVSVPVEYQASNGQGTTGLGLRMHFDSSVLAYDGLINQASNRYLGPQVLPDTLDYDDDPSTDRFVLMSWVDPASNWPGGQTPGSLFDSRFRVAGTANTDTMIRFSAASTDADFGFDGEDIRVSFVASTLDVDGNGTADALTDGLLISRYLSGLAGVPLLSGALGLGATRTTGDQITTYLAGLRTTVLDPDGDGVARPSTDGRLISRYLFGFRGPQLIQNAPFGPNATRTDAADIEAFLDQYMPGAGPGTGTITGGSGGGTGGQIGQNAAPDWQINVTELPGGMLEIVGTPFDDTIIIKDLGDGEVRVIHQLPGEQAYMDSTYFVNIVSVITGPGDDDVTYRTKRGIADPIRSIEIDMGNGEGDRLDAIFSEGTSFVATSDYVDSREQLVNQMMQSSLASPGEDADSLGTGRTRARIREDRVAFRIDNVVAVTDYGMTNGLATASAEGVHSGQLLMDAAGELGLFRGLQTDGTLSVTQAGREDSIMVRDSRIGGDLQILNTDDAEAAVGPPLLTGGPIATTSDIVLTEIVVLGSVDVEAGARTNDVHGRGIIAPLIAMRLDGETANTLSLLDTQAPGGLIVTSVASDDSIMVDRMTGGELSIIAVELDAGRRIEQGASIDVVLNNLDIEDLDVSLPGPETTVEMYGSRVDGDAAATASNITMNDILVTSLAEFDLYERGGSLFGDESQFGSTSVSSGSGVDEIGFSDSVLGILEILDTGGDNEIGLFDSTASRANISTGSGDDQIDLLGLTVDDDLRITTRQGDDNIDASVTVGDEFRTQLGAGNDHLNVFNAGGTIMTVIGSSGIDGFTVADEQFGTTAHGLHISKDATIDLGNGDDFADVAGMLVEETLPGTPVPATTSQRLLIPKCAATCRSAHIAETMSAT